MGGLCVQLRSLPFASIGDLLHNLDASCHLIHCGSHPGEKRHERPHKPTGSGHDDKLGPVASDAFDDRLRDLVRYRKTLVYERSKEINRLHKLLETANIKLTGGQ